MDTKIQTSTQLLSWSSPAILPAVVAVEAGVRTQPTCFCRETDIMVFGGCEKNERKGASNIPSRVDPQPQEFVGFEMMKYVPTYPAGAPVTLQTLRLFFYRLPVTDRQTPFPQT